MKAKNNGDFTPSDYYLFPKEEEGADWTVVMVLTLLWTSFLRPKSLISLQKRSNTLHDRWIEPSPSTIGHKLILMKKK